MKGWQFRWFTLDPDSGLLEYYVVRIDDQWLTSVLQAVTFLVAMVTRNMGVKFTIQFTIWQPVFDSHVASCKKRKKKTNDHN